MDIQSLSTPERILLAEQLWDSVRDKSDEIEVTPEQIKDTLPALMNSIKMIHTIARYYNTNDRMTGLFIKIPALDHIAFGIYQLAFLIKKEIPRPCVECIFRI